MDDASLGFLHVKAVDDCGHAGDFDGKCKWLRRVDAMIGEFLSMSVSKNYILAVTGDHTTSVVLKDHSHEPVPFVVCRCMDVGTTRFDDVDRFDEAVAAGGSLGRFCGSEVGWILLKFKQM